MYRYDEFDETLVRERVAQFRGQVVRRLAGDMTEDQFKPLRLMNGLYLQLHAYMLRYISPPRTPGRSGCATLRWSTTKAVRRAWRLAPNRPRRIKW